MEFLSDSAAKSRSRSCYEHHAPFKFVAIFALHFRRHCREKNVFPALCAALMQFLVNPDAARV